MCVKASLFPCGLFLFSIRLDQVWQPAVALSSIHVCIRVQVMFTCFYKELSRRAEPSDPWGRALLSCLQVLLPCTRFGAPAVELGAGRRQIITAPRSGVFGGGASEPIGVAFSRWFPSAAHVCLASKVSLQRRRGSGSIKLQLVFCNGLKTDVQQNQLSGQRRGAGTMANMYKRSGSKPIKNQ